MSEAGAPDCAGPEHFCIADTPMKQQQPFQYLSESGSESKLACAASSRAHQFQEVALSLETAATAIRKVIHRSSVTELTLRPPVDAGSPTTSAKSTLSSPSTSVSQRCGTASCASLSTSFTQQATVVGTFQADASVAAPASQAAGEAGDVTSFSRLTRENEALRGALTNAVSRLAVLEGEKEQFLAEGVFDLVNTVCRDGHHAPGVGGG